MMDKTKKMKIVTVVLTVLVLGGVLWFVLTQTKTGDVAPKGTDASEYGTTGAYAPSPSFVEYTTRALDRLTVAYPKEQKTVSRSSTFSFTGTCGTVFPLTCNDEPVKISAMGVFALEFELSLGENRFVFRYGDEVKEYTVEYKIDVLSQIAPGGATDVTPGTAIEIRALAYKDAAVSAQLNGQTIPMTATDRNDFDQIVGRGDQKTFVGTYTAPSAAQSMSLGAITVTATYNGESVSLKGGEVRLHADVSSIVAKATVQTGSYSSYYDAGTRGLLTPFTDHGLGSAQMCEILKDKAETTGSGDATDNSDILCSPLARGTFDYVVGGMTYEDELMYVLSSGKKVYAKETRLLNDAYVMPANALAAAGVTSGENTTDLYLSTTWAVPTGIVVGPQAYYSGYQGKPYNIASFTADHLDVTFYHTSSFSGAFALPSGQLLSSIEWIDNGNSSVTLRCRFARQGKFCGCSVDLTDDGRFRISINNVVKQKRLVVIDPGHGGEDPGAQSIFPEIKEAAINLPISEKVASVLRAQGVEVLMTRTGDTTSSLDERMLVGRQVRPDAFVAIHSDYTTSASTSGTHAFYYYPWSMPLADAIHRQMVDAYRNYIYKPGTAEYENVDRSIHFYPFQVTRVEECPSVLVECGFVSNLSDCSVMLTPACQDVLATSIANGIITYLNSLN